MVYIYSQNAILALKSQKKKKKGKQKMLNHGS